MQWACLSEYYRRRRGYGSGSYRNKRSFCIVDEEIDQSGSIITLSVEACFVSKKKLKYALRLRLN
jgi:hypothetical protein